MIFHFLFVSLFVCLLLFLAATRFFGAVFLKNEAKNSEKKNHRMTFFMIVSTVILSNLSQSLAALQ